MTRSSRIKDYTIGLLLVIVFAFDMFNAAQDLREENLLLPINKLLVVMGRVTFAVNVFIMLLFVWL